jgi:carboxymethylenebutenolidase
MPKRNGKKGKGSKSTSVSRRAFVKGVAGTVMVGTLTSEVKGMAQEEKPTGKALHDPNVVKEDVTYKSGDANVKTFLARPKNLQGKAPGVIVIQEIFGLVEHIKDVACRLALQGYVAIAPDLYTREGAIPQVTDFTVLREFVGKIPDSQIVGDLKAAMDTLKSRKDVRADRIGAVGFCMGGLYALLLSANAPDLKAAVSYYGRVVLPQKTANKPAGPMDVVDKIHAAVQGHYGSADQAIPVNGVEQFRDALKAHNKNVEFYIYDSAPHAFHNDTRESYRPEPAKLAWQRTLAWFDKHLKA